MVKMRTMAYLYNLISICTVITINYNYGQEDILSRVYELEGIMEVV